MLRCARTFAFSVILAASACHGEIVDPGPTGGAGGEGGSGGEADASFPLACDPLVPSYCGYPFPSDVYTVEDDTSPTGRRVAFKTAGLPKGKDGHEQDPAPWAKADGFSASSALVAEFPGATEKGLPGVLDLEASLAEDSPTVLIDAETGERVLHFSELDHSKDLDTTPAFLIHPAIALKDGHRYIVAIRGLVDAEDKPIPPSPAFAALRDETDSEDGTVSARRALYDDIFSKLEDAGVARNDLLLAWDFTTASRESNTGWLLHMRDQADELTGETGPAYTITSVDSDLDPTNILYRIKGTMAVPLYLENPGPGSQLLFDEDGMPMPNPEQPTYDVEWELLIPNSAQNGPVALLQHGHGLLGHYDQIEAENFRTFCNQYGYAIFAVRLAGMADDDQEWIIEQLVNGKVDNLMLMFHRLHQGFLDNLLLMKMVSKGLSQDPTYGAYLDPTKRVYWGISQGGIQGGVLMSLSKDINRGLLEVMGQPYNILLNRSVDFTPFFVVAGLQFPDSRAQQHFLGLVQMGWDRVEPAGYTKYMFNDPFPGLPDDRRVLMRVAIGDHQVTTFGGHIMARSVGASHLETGIREIYGLDATADPVDAPGAVYTEYDFGLPPEPTCNLPLFTCEDPHGKLRKLESSREQANTFFSTGVSENKCAGGVCDFSDLSGCTGDEDQNLCD